MSLFEKLFGREEKVADATALTWSALDNGARSKTGLSVNEANALRVSTVWGCCRVISEDVGKVPFRVMRENRDGSKEIAVDHAVHRVLSRKPNQWQTSMEWRMTMMLHALLAKGGYSYVNRHRETREVLELIPLIPSRVKPKQAKDWSVTYEVDDGEGGKVVLDRSDVLAVHGLSWNGLSALEVIQQGQEAIGLAMATEETQARLHGQGAKPGGVISTTANLTDKQVEKIKAQFAANYSGVGNAFKTLLLDNGLKFEPWMMTGVDAQHLETRRFQVEEICRLFRTFPSIIGYSDKAATYASAEAFFIAHVVHTLTPWFTLFEQACDRDLLTDADARAGLYTHFAVQGLMRGDSKTRSEFYESGIRAKWLMRNEVRRLEDLNPIPGLDELDDEDDDKEDVNDENDEE